MNKLVKQLRAQRQSWVDLEPGKRVQIIRPAESEFSSFLSGDGADRRIAVGLEHVGKYVTDWEGVTEAELLGAAVGSSDAVAFDASLWLEVAADRSPWFLAVSTAIMKSMTDHFEKKAEVSKN